MTYNQYNTNSSIFCLDKGSSLFGTVNYICSEYDESGEPTQTISGVGAGSRKIPLNELAYYVTQPKKTQRLSAKTDPIQIAIWETFDALNFDDIETKYLRSALQLCRDKTAYSFFWGNDYSKIPYVDDFTNYTYLYYSETVLDPTEELPGESFIGKYTNLNSIKINGNGESKKPEDLNPEKPEDLDPEKDCWEINKDGQIYKYNRRIKINKSTTENNPYIEFTYEKQKRTADIKLLTSADTDDQKETTIICDARQYDTYKGFWENNPETWRFLKVKDIEKDENGEDYDVYRYYCAQCNNRGYDIDKDWSIAIRVGTEELSYSSLGSGKLYSCSRCNTALLVYNSKYYIQYREEPEFEAWVEENRGYYRYQRLIVADGEIYNETKKQNLKPPFQPVNLTINKTDSLTKNPLANVRFKVELTNVKSMKDYQIPATKGTEKQNEYTVLYVKTDSNGQIVLTGIVPIDPSKPIKATITEVEVPDKSEYNGYYYIVDSGTKIELTMTYSNGSWAVTGDAKNGTHISSDAPTNSGENVEVTIKNQPYIKITGMVWNDGQTGEKNIQGPNGNKDNGEKGLAGVLVCLYDVGTEERTVQTTYTDENGQYEFIDIPKTNDGYRVVFNYDGINYQETKSLGSTGNDSKIEKIAETGKYEYYRDAETTTRADFNNIFKTISAGKATSNNGTKDTPLEYHYNNGVSTLKVKMDGTNLANTNQDGIDDKDFQMRARTQVYKTSQNNVNCGLVKKEVDLAAGTDIKEAKLTINDKTTTYNYQQIMNGELKDLDLDKILQNNSSTAENVIYNLYLYASDYNYRIDDYKTDIGGNNVPDNDNNNVADYEGLKNLEAYVTYNVILKNQTTKNAIVEEFVYYYDAAYTPYNIVSTDKYDVSIDEENRKITFTSKGDGFKLTSPNYRVEIDLTFKIEDKNGILRVDETATNVAEITKYSTEEGGLIDKDSEPGNAKIDTTTGTPKVGQYEDDTDEAKGLNIILRTDETRVISGTVFDDTDEKDGMLNNGNAGVNDVIVQLIEIKEIAGQYYEYIWQETISGGNTVKRLSSDGYSVEEITYRESAPKDGTYEFTDFIPGNYIIRFIYGDGRTYDVDSQEYKNVAKYNGQDYKSTIDLNYNRLWYNTSPYTAGESVARDNEARRLEVMAYSTRVDSVNGQALKDKSTEALEATWMCAETSRINIPVDNVEDAKIKTAENYTNFTTTSYEYTDANTKVLFDNMNFGLALRPQTKITLEKHITALKITPSGAGAQSIVDAKATNIADIVNGTEVTVQGVTQGLATIKSTATNRGFWQVATDVEELLQGADLEVEYTYVIRNDGDKDYLSKTLVDAYLDKDIETYNGVLLNARNIVKENMKNGTYSYKGTNDLSLIGDYLGISYYTGAEFDDDFVDALIQMDVNLDGRVNNMDLRISTTIFKRWGY